jgi:peroxiredoxin Q/BCP
VSDPDNKFAQAVDAIVEKKMYGKTYTGPARAAFVIDIDGTVLGLIEKIDTKNHADELFELIESINTPA